MILIDEYLRTIPKSDLHSTVMFTFEPDTTVETSELISRFLSSSVVFYPGSGFDQNAVDVFNKGRVANAFLYADNGINTVELNSRLKYVDGKLSFYFRGYDIEHYRIITENDFSFLNNANKHQKEISGCFVIFKRQADSGNDHGFELFALMYIFEDAVEVFDLVFPQNNPSASPIAVLLQNHWFGGCHFGKGTPLEARALGKRQKPQYLLVGSNTSGWGGFGKVANLEPAEGGMYKQQRYLWRYRGGR